MLTLVDAMYDWSRESRAYREAPGEAWSERDGVRDQGGWGGTCMGHSHSCTPDPIPTDWQVCGTSRDGRTH